LLFVVVIVCCFVVVVVVVVIVVAVVVVVFVVVVVVDLYLYLSVVERFNLRQNFFVIFHDKNNICGGTNAVYIVRTLERRLVVDDHT